MESLRDQHASWCKRLHQAIQADSWGQVIEAVEAYEGLSQTLLDALLVFHDLSKEQKGVLEKTAKSMDLRAKCICSVEGERDAPTKDEMEHILDALRDVLQHEQPVFPLDLAGGAGEATKSSTIQVVEPDEHDLLDEYADTVNEVKPLNRAAGGSYLDLQLLKVGLKDASVYVNPTVVVSVYDRDGKRMEEPKETAIGVLSDEPQHVAFRKATIQLETSLESMEERGAAVFFEFYHYKAKKRKKSCRCWAMLEMDEVTRGDSQVALALELYQKPMDPKRKRISLFTVKQLYLHLQIDKQTVQ